MLLHLESLAVGPLQANCILVVDPETKSAAVVDPGDEADRIIHRIEQLQLKVTSILLTHAHGDHLGAVGALKVYCGATILVHPEEKDWLENPDRNLSSLLGTPIVSPPADGFLNEGDTVPIGGEQLTVLHTPGHSPGGLCFYRNGILLTGDLLFLESIGRSDLPGGDGATLMKSLKEKILPLPGPTLCYPGHGDTTTIAHEIKNNFFLRT